MPEIVRTRKSRYRSDSYSDDERSYKTTVHRYRIARSPSPNSDYDPHIEVTRVERVEAAPRSHHSYDRDSAYARDEPTRQRTLVYEREREREQPGRPWERETWEREEDVRVDRGAPGYELVTRETEYYGRPEPVAAPLVIRNKHHEAQRHEPRREEDVYYRRHEVRDTAAPEEDYVSERKVIRRHGSGSRSISSEEGVVVRRSRARSRSHSPHHKLHLAEGAAAGAAAAALITRHRSKSGVRQNKGANLAGGAALGAIGAELATRAHSHYGHRHGRSRSRRRSPSPEHSKLKMGLGAAVIGVAAVAATKYLKGRHDTKRAEERRGRSRTRSGSRGRASSEGRHLDPKHRRQSIAKAGAAGAAALAIAQAVRARSKSGKGKSRSKSRVRTGAELVGAGLAAAGAAGIYENRKAKKERKALDRERAASASRSRSRSRGGYDSEYERPGLVEYGAQPLTSRGLERGYASPEPVPRIEPQQPRGILRSSVRANGHRGGHSRSPSRSPSRSRSRSRVRDVVTGAAAATAAAVGVRKYQNRRRQREEERERERGRERSE